MPLETIQPDGVGAIDDWALGAGASKQGAVQLPDDDDTSYISETVGAMIQEFECANATAILAADTITQVKLKYRAKRVGGISASVRPGLRVGGGTLDEGVAQALTTSYADYEDSFALDPDGGSWSLADINALRIRMLLSGVLASEARVTTLVAEITYTRASKKSQHTMLTGVG